MNQTTSAVTTDRYVSFCGIECNRRADQLMESLQHCLQQASTDQRWRDYFSSKFQQQKSMGHDNLFFVGAQMNTLYSFFEELDHQQCLTLLWQLEQECC